MTTTITREHRTAIDRLAMKPGTCTVPGCGETLLLVDIDPSYDPSPTERFDPKKVPPPRFACPEHDVWITECFDEGYPDDKAYPHGLFHAVLRDVADPAWRWLPEHMRAAAVRAGFAVRVTAGGILPHPRFRVGVCSGRAWATDGWTLLDIGQAAEAELALERADIEVHPASAKTRVLAEYRLRDGDLAETFTRFTAGGYQPVEPRPADVAGLGEPWAGCQVAGDAVLPQHVVQLVAEVYGAVTWRARGRLDAVFAVRSDVCAAVMPIDVEAAERRAGRQPRRAGASR
jgi:hypothetical protein